MCPVIGISLLLVQGGQSVLAGPKFPEVDGKAVLARVNGETILLDDFFREMSDIHEEAGQNKPVSRPNTTVLLNRMIDTRLVVQEARNIGLDELPEVKSAFDAYEKNRLRSMLFGDHVRDIRKPDGKEVDKLYRAAVKEVKLASVSVPVEREADAKRLEAALGSGGDWKTLANRLVDEGIAEGNVEGEYLKFRTLLPHVAEAVSAIKPGQVTPLLKIGDRVALVKFLGVRFPEDPEARKQAEDEALQAKRTAALKAYAERLKKQYAKIDQKLLEELDYDSPDPGFESLLKDTRTLAEVAGEDPVTVRELSEALRKKFFHGMEGAARKKRINRRKEQVLDEILFKRVTDKEARRLKIDRTPAYLYDVEENRRGILFGIFVQKVIEPEIRLSEADLQAYWKEHIGEYTTPEMMRIESIAFSGREDAEKAADRLRKGSDFQWTRANAEGRVDPGESKDLLNFGKGPILTGGLPEGVRKAVAGAAGGEYRRYSPSGGPYYVLYVREVIPPAPQSFESVKEQISVKVFEEKRSEALQEYVKKIREASDIKIYATENELRKVVQGRGR